MTANLPVQQTLNVIPEKRDRLKSVSSGLEATLLKNFAGLSVSLYTSVL